MVDAPSRFSQETSASTRGVILVAAVGTSAVAITAVAAPFLIVPAFTKLGRIPWMATPVYICQKAVSKLPASLSNQKAHRLIDLGSGDGRFVIEAAKAGYLADGIELNPVLVALSYLKAMRAGVLLRVRFRMVDFWKVPLGDYSAVTCFGVAPVMQRLQVKLCNEAKKGTTVICFRFPLKNISAKWSEGELYMYEL